MDFSINLKIFNKSWRLLKENPVIRNLNNRTNSQAKHLTKEKSSNKWINYNKHSLQRFLKLFIIRPSISLLTQAEYPFTKVQAILITQLQTLGKKAMIRDNNNIVIKWVMLVNLWMDRKSEEIPIRTLIKV